MADDREEDNENERGTLEEAATESIEPDFSKKHPLEHRWTLWFDNPSGKQTVNKYGQSLRAVFSFDNVEDFWCLYNNIRTPGQLSPSATYYLFKEGIEPKWEDPKNVNGGSWTASVPKGPNAKTTLDGWWLNTVLACIGEQFTEGHEICGVAVLVRQAKDRIELWTKTATNEALQVSVGKHFKKLMDLPESQSIGFQVFADKLDSNSNTKAKDRYTV